VGAQNNQLAPLLQAKSFIFYLCRKYPAFSTS
jgi:hypothetical protein